jgi:queuine tRNA-ribosyltransferase
VLPTRIARNGAVFTRNGRLNLRNAQYAEDPAPIEEDCACYTCSTFSRAYLRHLVMAKEITGLHLATWHNLHFMLETMRRIRQSILDGAFADYKAEFLATYQVVSDAAARDR